MAQVLSLVAILAAPLMLGAALLAAIGKPFRADRVEYCGQVIVFGSLLVAALMALALALAIPIEPWTLWSLYGGVSALLMWVGARRGATGESFSGAAAGGGSSRLAYGIALAFAIGFVLHSAWQARLVPILVGDEAAIWTSKARFLLLAGAFDDRLQGFLAGSPFVWLQHADYPLLNPLLQAHALAHFSPDSPVVGRVPVQFFGVALALLLTSAMRARVPAWIGVPLLLIVFGLERTAMGLSRSDADLMLATALLGMFDTLGRLVADGDRRRLPMFALFAASALWTKHDAAVPVIAIGCSLSVDVLLGGRVLRRVAARRIALLWGLVAAAPVVFTIGFNARMGVANDLMGANVRGKGLIELILEQFGERVWIVTRWFFTEQFWVSERTGYLALLLLALVLLRSRAWRTTADRFAIGAIGFAFAGYALVLIGSFHELAYILDHAGARLTYHLMPTITMACAAMLGATDGCRMAERTADGTVSG
jgi:hypothetical protein